MIRLYTILVWCLFLAALPLLPVIYALSRKRRANMLARFGFQAGLPDKAPDEKRIWIHALSVGEVKSAYPFVEAFKKRHPDWKVVVTATTRTGFETAQEQWGRQDGPVDLLAYFPFDIGFAVKKALDGFSPDLVVLTETDLWPGFLHQARKRNIPVVLINARMSGRSLKGYLFARRVGGNFFSLLSHIMVQSRTDEERFTKLGISQAVLCVTGNIKFDQPIRYPDEAFIREMKTRLNIEKGTRVLLAGSTHEGEESILLSVCRTLKPENGELQMVIAPRNPERCRNIAESFRSAGAAAVLFSDLHKEPDKKRDKGAVVLIDSIGKLAALYSLCDAAFIGGSLVPCGGHNPLEPAAFGKPVLFGPDMSDFLEISQMLVDRGGAFRVRSGRELEEKLALLFDDSTVSRQMGDNSRAVFSSNSGAVERIIDKMEQLEIV